jgi:hypothetical protein
MSAHDHDQDSNTGANIVIGVTLVGLALARLYAGSLVVLKLI